MSLDSITRINDYFDTAVSIPNGLYTIHVDKNEAIEDDMGGDVWVRVSTEASDDDMTGQSLPKLCYKESGVFIIEIFCAKGLGNMNLYGPNAIITIIRNAFRNKKLQPASGEEGVILFEKISTTRSFEQPSRGGRAYFRNDVFIPYQKNYQL